jgi:histidinol dehydrogenase
LGLADFQIAISIQEASPDGFRYLGPTARVLAEMEGLDAHALAVKLRLESLECRSSGRPADPAGR